MPNELTPQARIKSLIETNGIKKGFDEVLGKRSAGFVSSILSAVAMNEGLSKCDPMSIISSAMIAATLDLPINPSLGMAHIVPYKGVGTFQMGWKGFVQLALRSGQYKTINATPIYEGQIKTHNQFTGEMEFVNERKSEKVIGYLLFFKLLNGFEKYHYWTKEQCEEHGKRYSAAYKKNFGPWVERFDDMALKTVVKLGLGKYGILSIDMQKALENDEAIDGTFPDAIEKPATPAPAVKSSRLRDIVDTTAKEPEQREAVPGELPI
jgi:recombination protein RecT